MKNDISSIDKNRECDETCQIYRSNQETAYMVAAEAQSLFQGFLKCIDRMWPDSHLSPEQKKGAQMLGHFTTKLDAILQLNYNTSKQCSYDDNGDVVCPQKQLKQLNRELTREKVLYSEAASENKLLQSKCRSLELQVERLLGELAKRRTQYNNRILISIFESQFKLSNRCEDGSFFDIVPRERLSDFLPFIRNIVLGPAISDKFDEQVELAIEPFKNEHGVISMSHWDDVLESQKVIRIINWVTDVLFERCQHHTAFEALVRRKSPVSVQKMPNLIALFESMGAQGAINAIAC